MLVIGTGAPLALYGRDVSGPTTLPPKRDVARALLLRGCVFVHLDPRVTGVAVPDWLTDQPQLVLQIGLDMPIPIPDLRVDAAGVYGTLSFQRAPFTAQVPWDAIFALVGDDGRGMVWPEDLPPEIAADVAREAAMRRADRDGPDLRLVRQAEGGTVTDLEDVRGRGMGKRRRSRLGAARPRTADLPPYLRVIK